jgi:hypothetical protein
VLRVAPAAPGSAPKAKRFVAFRLGSLQQRQNLARSAKDPTHEWQVASPPMPLHSRTLFCPLILPRFNLASRTVAHFSSSDDSRHRTSVTSLVLRHVQSKKTAKVCLPTAPLLLATISAPSHQSRVCKPTQLCEPKKEASCELAKADSRASIGS